MDIKGLTEKVKQFYTEVRIELKKISWPSRKETVASTSVVLIIVLIISFYLGVADMVLSRLIRIILS